MTVGGDVAALLVVLAIELAVLWRGQRRLFWRVAGASGSRTVAYLLSAPGTILHEAAHYLACLALGVPAGRRAGPSGGRGPRARLFWPTRTADGHVILGSVPHARTGPLRQALIATAPLILVPPALALATVALLGPHALSQLPDVLARVSPWRAISWCYLTLSCGQAVFPSPGDHIGLLGGVSLLALAAGASWVLLGVGDAASLAEVLGAAVGVLAVPAAAAALMLIALGALGPGRAP